MKHCADYIICATKLNKLINIKEIFTDFVRMLYLGQNLVRVYDLKFRHFSYSCANYGNDLRERMLVTEQ